MTGIRMELAGADINRVYPRDLPDLFAGGQIIAVGRYRRPGQSAIRLTGRIGDREHTFEFPAALVAYSDDTYCFVEKLWATRRVGEIINELDLKGRNQELIDELVRLSTRHGILTPYTAFLADERTDLHAMTYNAKSAEYAAFDSKDGFATNPSGATGVNLRSAKAELQQQAQAQWAGAQRWKDAGGNERLAENVQVVGSKAMYRRGNRWIDPMVTAEEEKSAEQVEQFSDKYFELARSNAKLRQYLALPEGCTVRIEGKVYQINARQERGG
jgi:Ca-activated chloride channel family protein